MKFEQLIGVVKAVLGKSFPLAADELEILNTAEQVAPELVKQFRSEILAGKDPLGDSFCAIKSASSRRKYGQTFTPDTLVAPMLRLARRDAETKGAFVRIVDPGCGSGRFLLGAARYFPNAHLVGIEKDPICALLVKANLSVLGLTDKAQIVREDYTKILLDEVAGRTLFIGNPPYVRHHDIAEERKDWYARSAVALGARKPSKLAGLHIHFFVQTFFLARPADLGVFVTAAEWLDTGYGHALRAILSGPLGGQSVHVLAATAEPFPGVQTTAAITAFAPHQVSDYVPVVPVTDINHLGELEVGREAVRFTEQDRRWNTQFALAMAHADSVGNTDRIGDRFSVSRGQVTGMNRVWIVPEDYDGLPERFLVPCITAAKEIFRFGEASGGSIATSAGLKKLVSLPEDLTSITGDDRALVDAFIERAMAQGAHESFVARQRRAWWSIPLQRPAPIICTYMARRRPVFIRNVAGVSLINVAHAVRPRYPMSPADLDAACDLMNHYAQLSGGRPYSGGLIKFEPKDIERIAVSWPTDPEARVAA